MPTVPPGITNEAVLEFRYEERELAESADPSRHHADVILSSKLQVYEEYVRSVSFLMDVRILGRTLFGLLKRRESTRRE